MSLFDQMTTFVRVVDAGSLSAAARALRLSPAAVSRRLRGLETHLRVNLLLRSDRGVRVTEAGRRFYAESLRILGSIARANAAATDGDAISGPLVVSVAISFGLEAILPRLARFASAHRSVQLELRVEDPSVDLLGEDVDVALREGGPLPSTVHVCHALGVETWRVAVAAPSYLRRHGAPSAVGQLARHACLVHLGPGGPGRRLAFRRGEEIADVEVHGAAMSNEALTLRQFARAGLGIAVVPERLIDADLREGRLRRLLPGWRSGPSYNYVVHRRDLEGGKRVRALITALGVARDAAGGALRPRPTPSRAR